MDSLLRRRELGETEIVLTPICKTPYSVVATNNQSSWDSATQTGTVAQNAVGWPALLWKGLKYKVSDIFANYSYFRIEFDVTLSWDSSLGGDGLKPQIGAYTTSNPGNNSSNRKRNWGVTTITENGTYHVCAEIDLSTISDSSDYATNWFGFTIFLNGIGSATISNIEMGVY